MGEGCFGVKGMGGESRAAGVQALMGEGCCGVEGMGGESSRWMAGSSSQGCWGGGAARRAGW